MKDTTEYVYHPSSNVHIDKSEPLLPWEKTNLCEDGLVKNFWGDNSSSCGCCSVRCWEGESVWSPSCWETESVESLMCWGEEFTAELTLCCVAKNAEGGKRNILPNLKQNTIYHHSLFFPHWLNYSPLTLYLAEWSAISLVWWLRQYGKSFVSRSSANNQDGDGLVSDRGTEEWVLNFCVTNSVLQFSTILQRIVFSPTVRLDFSSSQAGIGVYRMTILILRWKFGKIVY